jgi:glycine dehydrogenase subunit 2
MEILLEKSKEGKRAFKFPEIPDFDIKKYIPEKYLREKEAFLPSVSETEITRHFNALAERNYHVDKGFYPLGSCTMKYNPKINEELARLPGFTNLHPLIPEKLCQGALKLMKELENLLCEISGMDAVSLQPSAGANGELTGMLIVRKYHTEKGNSRKYVLVPDSAHGTNPASVTLSGYIAKTIKSNEKGLISIPDLKKNLNEEVAAIMITNPNTLGLFEVEICEITKLVHEAGALVYLDGANLNAFVGIIKPRDLGFDIVHFNLHKTFSAPHGGGGPGSGPIGVVKQLEKYLPIPRIVFENGEYKFSYDFPHSIGKVHSFYGNFLVMIKAYAYILTLGYDGLRQVACDAILNANYLREKIKDLFENPYRDFPCMHEFVVSGENLKRKYGVRTLDVAKRLLDYGFHAPTIYFPLIVPEALMIEPTETESKETLDAFAETLRKIVKEAEQNPDLLKNAPYNTPVRRLDETLANRNPVPRWKKNMTI